MGMNWELIEIVYGRLEAEALQSYLEAEGVPVELFQEGAGHYGFVVTTGALGRVDLFVPKEHAERARDLLDAYYQGDFSEDDLDSE